MRGAGGLYGYIDKTGTMKISAEYIYAKDFSCGLAAVSENGNDWFYIDRNGMPITIMGYKSVGNPFHQVGGFPGMLLHIDFTLLRLVSVGA